MAAFPASSPEISSTTGTFPKMPPSANRSASSVLSQIKQTLQSLVDKTKLAADFNDKEADNISEGQNLSPILHLGLSKTENLRTKEAYNSRLATFKPVDWMGKPLSLSPPLMAQYGWKCIGKHTVKCCSCSAILVVKLPWPNSPNYLEKCLEYRHKVISSHLKICVWPSYPCNDGHLNPLSPGNINLQDVIKDYRKSYNSLIKLQDSLPNIKPNHLEKYGFTEEIMASLINIGDVTDADQEVARSAAVIAACGWNIKRQKLK